MPKGELLFKNGDFYEGEIKSDQPNGTGIYKFKNKSYYEGQFQNGNFQGKGKLIDTFNQITIVGYFSNGKADGKCKIQYNDGSIYQGETKDGVRCGKGILSFGSSSLERQYKGWFAYDQFQGQGELTFKNGDIYRGKFSEGVIEGEAEILTQNFSYVGMVKKGIIEGKGSIKYSSGDLYEGQFMMGQKHGYGKYTYLDGSIYQGYWEKDIRKGKGKIVYQNGDIFEGLFQEDDQDGISKINQWKIEGQLKDGDFDGNLKLTKAGTIIQTSYMMGIQEGLTKIQKNIKGQKISYRGQFQKGRQKPYSVYYSKRI